MACGAAPRPPALSTNVTRKENTFDAHMGGDEAGWAALRTKCLRTHLAFVGDVISVAWL